MSVNACERRVEYLTDLIYTFNVLVMRSSRLARMHLQLSYRINRLTRKFGMNREVVCSENKGESCGTFLIGS